MMKVHPDILVHSGRRHASSGEKVLLEELKAGSELSARVLERISPTRARIEIAGRKMEAEFPRGVPQYQDLNLRLQGAKGGTVFFALSGRTAGGDEQGRLASYTVLAKEEMDLRVLRGLADHLRSGIRGVYAFNSLLLPRGQDGRGRRTAPHDILNDLLKAGIKREDAVIISYIFSSGRSINLNYLAPLMTYLAGSGKKDGIGEFRAPHIDEKECLSAVEHLVERIGSLLDDKQEEGRRFLEEVMSRLLPDGFVDTGGIEENFITYQCDKGFQSCRYISNGSNILIELDLSLLGRVEALVREEGKAVQISLFCATREAAAGLKKDIRALERDVHESTGKTAMADVCCTEDAVKNIIEIYSSLMLNNVFDARA